MARWLRRAHRPGRPWSHLAVLARTNDRLEPVARALERAGIPYRVGGGAKETARAGSRVGRAPSGTAGPAPSRVGRARHDAPGATDRRPAGLGYRRHAGVGPGASPALAELGRRTRASNNPTARWASFLDWVVGRRGDGCARSPTPSTRVELSTFHRAKGLEWPAVAVVGLEDGMVPIAYAVTPAALAEERRLLYVAVTRAEDELWCSWARTRRAGDRTWRCDPSPLLAGVERASRDSGTVPDGPPGSRPASPPCGRCSPHRPTGPAEDHRGPAHTSTSTSTNTGAWSDGCLPLRALRSTSAEMTLAKRPAHHDEIDPQAHVLVEVPRPVVPPGEELVLVVAEAERVDEPPLLERPQALALGARSHASPPPRRRGPTRRGPRVPR